MAVSALVIGRILADFTPTLLVQVIQGAAVITIVLNLIAVTPARPVDEYAGVYAGFYLRYALPPALAVPFLLVFPVAFVLNEHVNGLDPLTADSTILLHACPTSSTANSSPANPVTETATGEVPGGYCWPDPALRTPRLTRKGTAPGRGRSPGVGRPCCGSPGPSPRGPRPTGRALATARPEGSRRAGGDEAPGPQVLFPSRFLP